MKKIENVKLFYLEDVSHETLEFIIEDIKQNGKPVVEYREDGIYAIGEIDKESNFTIENKCVFGNIFVEDDCYNKIFETSKKSVSFEINSNIK